MFFHVPDLAIFWMVVAARILVPLAIPRYPLPAILVSLVVDGCDQTIFEKWADLNLDFYQGYDKALDVYYLTIAYLSTMRNWSNASAFGISQFLFYYRLVGVVLFELLQVRWILLIFPNTFEYFFILYEAIRTRWSPIRMSTRFLVVSAAAIWIVIKLPQEWWIHVAQLDATDVIREDIFGVPLETGWLEIIDRNRLVFFGLIAGMVGLLWLWRWLLVHKLPPEDWRFTLDANSPDRDITVIPGSEAIALAHPKIFGIELVEKAALFSFVSIIFSQILPQMDLRPSLVTIGVSAIVLLNILASEVLRAWGANFGSAIRQFFIMAGINAGIAVLITQILLRNLKIPLVDSLFFILLLALMVTFYDRYRPLYQERVRNVSDIFRERVAAFPADAPFRR